MHLEFAPPQELGDSIKCFWYDSRDVGEQLSAIKVLPDGNAEIIFYFGACYVDNKGEMELLPSPFMVGMLDQPVDFYTKGRFEIIGVRCYPWTVFDLLGLPSAKQAVHVFVHPIAQLQPRLQKHISDGKINEAIAEVQAYFSIARVKVPADSTLHKAGIILNEAKGSLPVSQVAKAAHITVRTLERNFKQSSGYTVKDVSALMRFEQVRNRLWHYPDTSIAGLAMELGYTDQSHLSREFKRYTGTTPGAFVRKAKKARQSVSDDFVAFIQD